MSVIYDRLKAVDNTYIHYYAADMSGDDYANIAATVSKTKEDILQNSLEIYNKKIEGMNQSLLGPQADDLSNSELGEIHSLIKDKSFDSQLQSVFSEAAKASGKVNTSIATVKDAIAAIDSGSEALSEHGEHISKIMSEYQDILDAAPEIRQAIISALESSIVNKTTNKEYCSIEELLSDINEESLQEETRDILRNTSNQEFKIENIDASKKSFITSMYKSLILTCSLSKAAESSDYAAGLSSMMGGDFGTHSSGTKREGTLNHVMLQALQNRLNNVVGVGGEIAFAVGLDKAIKKAEKDINDAVNDFSLQVKHSSGEKRLFEGVRKQDSFAIKQDKHNKKQMFSNKQLDNLYNQMTKHLGSQKSDVTLKITNNAVQVSVDAGVNIKSSQTRGGLKSTNRVVLQSGSTLASLLFRDSIMSSTEAASILSLLTVRRGAKLGKDGVRILGKYGDDSGQNLADCSWNIIKQQLPYRAFLAMLAENPNADNTFCTYMVYQNKVYSIGKVILKVQEGLAKAERDALSLSGISKDNSAGFERQTYAAQNVFKEPTKGNRDGIKLGQMRSQETASAAISIMQQTKIRLTLNSQMLINML